jgi:multimeric flavodoxin WrbA
VREGGCRVWQGGVPPHPQRKGQDYWDGRVKFSSMAGPEKILLSREVQVGGKACTLSILEEDLSRLYPGMARYTLRLESEGQVLDLFRTNSYEYSPTVALDAEKVVRQRAAEWERALAADPVGFTASLEKVREAGPPSGGVDAIIVQGSPRADGNCSILAGWAAEEVRALGRKARVVYLDDLSIHPCIGCYQCYNTGSCTFDDDMSDLLRDLGSAALLVICTPVYTNTVPGGLKIFIDRCQAFHAQRNLFSSIREQKGLLLSVAGRKGAENFTCITRVVIPFMRNLGITPSGEVLLDGIDRARDIRNLPGIREEVGRLVGLALRG